MNTDGNAYFDLCFHRSLVQCSPASGHVCDELAEAIAARTASFLENDRATWCVLRYCPARISCGRCCGGFLRNLSPRKRCRTCQGYTSKNFLHDFPLLVYGNK